MAKFEVYGKFELKKEGVTADAVAQLLKSSLSKHYFASDITVTPSGIIVKGNLSSIWERAVTNADVKIKIEGNELFYRVDGDSSIGAWSYVWGCLGFITGFFFIWFVVDLVDYLICRDRPKRYFEEAFKSVQFELG
ncbi:MAG: hypothetical protein ACOX9E_11340 [Lentisphaeria bacterium]